MKDGTIAIVLFFIGLCGFDSKGTFKINAHVSPTVQEVDSMRNKVYEATVELEKKLNIDTALIVIK